MNRRASLALMSALAGLQFGQVHPIRPVQRRSVGVCRIGGGQHERLGFAGVAPFVGAREPTQPVDRTGEPELGGPEALDEIAASVPTGVLALPEHRVDR